MVLLVAVLGVSSLAGARPAADGARRRAARSRAVRLVHPGHVPPPAARGRVGPSSGVLVGRIGMTRLAVLAVLDARVLLIEILR
jgi:hypothetical protein